MTDRAEALRRKRELEKQFLQILEAHRLVGARRRDMPPAARGAERARQECRKLGWAVYEERDKGKRWWITDEGRRTLLSMEGGE